MTIRVFVDSDVIISSLISRTGAAYLLMHDIRIVRFVSDISFSELKRVAVKLHILEKELVSLIRLQCKEVWVGDKGKALKQMADYTRDTGDAHIVLGAKRAKVKFLVTYNMKHYRKEKIQEDLRIIVLPPAFLLQYLRSLN